MSEWKECKLGDVADLVNGYAFKSADFSDQGIPVIKIKNIASGNLTLDDIQYYPYEINNRLKQFVLKNGDILIAMTGSHVHQPSSMVGKVTRYDKTFNALLNQRVGRIVSKDLNILNEDFIYYFLKQDDVAIDLAINSGGSANQANISSTQIKNLEILLPPVFEQRSIAAVLSSLDDKIDLLHRQNKTLEGIAESLWRKLFVVDADEGWRTITLKECCRVITKGTTPTTLKKAFVTQGINFIKVNCLDENSNFLRDKFDQIDKETDELLRRSRLEDGDILYSIAGTIGRMAIVNKDILPANTNQALAILRVDNNIISSLFIKYCLKDKVITGNLHSKIVHAVQPNLSLGEIADTVLPYPPQKLLNEFIGVIGPMELKLRINKSQICILEKLRDSLLPKLLCGEVKVQV